MPPLLHVLLIDDDPDDRTLIARTLLQDYPGVQIHEAADPAALDQALSRGGFDLAITDYHLPWSDGLSVFKAVKAYHPGLPVIMITGSGSDEIAVSAISSGLEDCVIKSPTYLPRLSAAIRSVLDRTSIVRQGQEARTRLAVLVDAANDAIIASDSTKAILTWNKAAERMFGYSAAEILGKPVSSLMPERYRGDHGSGMTRFLVTGDKRIIGRTLEIAGLRKDGTEFPIEMSLSTWNSGPAVAFGAIIRDISDRKRAEETLQKTEEQLRMAQKMESIGRLAGGIAHDFNNLLTVINGHCEMILGTEGLDPELAEETREIRRAGERATELTRQLLAFSRRQVLKPVVLDLNAILTGMEKMLRRVIGEDIALDTVKAPDLGCIKADPGQVEQVIMNLAVNSRDAMPAGGTLTIKTSNIDVDSSHVAAHPLMVCGPHVQMTVTDSGIGMDPQTQAHAFEPFFTTKPKGQGTGLGLSTVYGIVKQSSGFIWLTSEPGKGTTFELYFPRVTSQANERVTPPLQSSPFGKETLLLVEDEPMVRALALQILRKCGYTVLEAPGPGEALEMAARHPGKIDLMVTDVVMPQMSGHEMAQRMKSVRADMKVIFMSGYTEDTGARHKFGDAAIHFIQKPFSPGDMARKVREVLDTRPA